MSASSSSSAAIPRLAFTQLPRQYESFLDALAVKTRHWLEAQRKVTHGAVKEACHIMIDSSSRRREGDEKERKGRSCFLEDPKTIANIEKMSKEIIRLFTPETPHILSTRILVAPKDQPGQDWHLDFAREGNLAACTIFIALTPATNDNCTEYVTFKNIQKKITRTSSSHTVNIHEHDVDVRALLMRKFDVACLRTSTVPHRRSPTFRSERTRLTLNIDFTLNMKDARKFVDGDWFDSAKSGGIVPKAIVDNLSSEIIVRLVRGDDDTKFPHANMPRDGPA